VPLLIDAAQIGEGYEVLDVGCGTGGFARGIASRASALVTGCDEAENFIEFARNVDPAAAVRWVVGDAAALPFDSSSFDRVLLSLILHQLAEPADAVGEACRVLRPGGIALVRTVAPDDARLRVPQMYLPSMGDADAARLPTIDTICRWLTTAGFIEVEASRHLRNKVIDVDEEERALRAEIAGRYTFVSPGELEEGVAAMRAAARENAPAWTDPRPTWIATAKKPPR